MEELTVQDILSHVYNSSFTPLGEKEQSKECPSCKRFLPPPKFKCRPGTRDGKKGTIRNCKCRECESKASREKKGERAVRVETAIDTLDHEVIKMKRDFIEALTALRKDIDRCRAENKIMKRQIEDLMDSRPKSSVLEGGSKRESRHDSIDFLKIARGRSSSSDSDG